MAIVYRHIRLDKNEPFYIGIGKKISRAFEKTRRNKHWQNIAKFGYDVEILFDDLTWEKAQEKEKEFIKLYGRKDLNIGVLCNHTNGGEGTYGRIYKHSKETLLKISKNRTGIPSKKKGIPLLEKTKLKISNTLKGKKQSAKTKLKRSVSCTGLKRSEQSKMNISLGKKGIKFSEKHKENIIKSCGRKVLKIDENGNLIKEYVSIESAAKDLGLISKSIRSYFNSGRKYIKGHIIIKKDQLDIQYGNSVIQTGE
jgi:hypothetical protein